MPSPDTFALNAICRYRLLPTGADRPDKSSLKKRRGASTYCIQERCCCFLFSSADPHPVVDEVVNPPEVETTGSSDAKLVGIRRVEAEECHVARKHGLDDLKKAGVLQFRFVGRLATYVVRTRH